MTSATAIVSPIARPRPIITADTTPPRLCGNTEPRIISQRVAPSPYAASFSERGRRREHLARDRGDDRRDHDRDDDPGGHVAQAGLARVGEERLQDRDVAGRRRDVLVDVGERRAQHEERPQPVDDRRDRGEEVDGVDHGPAQPPRRDLGDEQRDPDAHRHRDAAARSTRRGTCRRSSRRRRTGRAPGPSCRRRRRSPSFSNHGHAW